MKLFGLLAAVSAERTFVGNVVYRMEGISQETIGYGYTNFTENNDKA